MGDLHIMSYNSDAFSRMNFSWSCSCGGAKWYFLVALISALIYAGECYSKSLCFLKVSGAVVDSAYMAFVRVVVGFYPIVFLLHYFGPLNLDVLKSQKCECKGSHSSFGSSIRSW